MKLQVEPYRAERRTDCTEEPRGKRISFSVMSYVLWCLESLPKCYGPDNIAKFTSLRADSIIN